MDNCCTVEDFLRSFVVRIGQHSSDKPRRLLVQLQDEQSTAIFLLQSSWQLRSADNEIVSRTVFINLDLTPAAIKLAFDERQKEKQQRSTHNKPCDRCAFNVVLPTTITADSVEIRATASNDLNHSSSTHHETPLKQLISDDTVRTVGTMMTSLKYITCLLYTSDAADE